MKTERRHELQTNKLADLLGQQMEAMRPHAKTIMAAGVLGAVVVIVAAVIVSDRKAAEKLAWDDFYLALSASDRDALADVAKTHAGTAVALWAKQAQADADLRNGIAALYTNRDEAYRALDDAKRAYGEVVNSGSNHAELMRHSLFGMAQANEATSNLDKARDLYSQVVQRFPETAMALESRQRLEQLKDPQIERWYNWFARQKPKPPSPHAGLPNLPGMPDNLTDLSDNPDLPLLPTTPATGDQGASSVPPDRPSATPPAAVESGKEPGAEAASEKSATESAEPTAPPAAPVPTAAPPADAQPDAGAEKKESAKSEANPSSPSTESAPPAGGEGNPS